MNTRTLAAALAGATLFGLTAAQAAPKPKPKANRAGAVTVTVMVTNSRKVDLKRFSPDLNRRDSQRVKDERIFVH